MLTLFPESIERLIVEEVVGVFDSPLEVRAGREADRGRAVELEVDAAEVSDRAAPERIDRAVRVLPLDARESRRHVVVHQLALPRELAVPRALEALLVDHQLNLAVAV